MLGHLAHISKHGRILLCVFCGSQSVVTSTVQGIPCPGWQWGVNSSEQVGAGCWEVLLILRGGVRLVWECLACQPLTLWTGVLFAVSHVQCFISLVLPSSGRWGNGSQEFCLVPKAFVPTFFMSLEGNGPPLWGWLYDTCCAGRQRVSCVILYRCVSKHVSFFCFTLILTIDP